MHSIVQPMSSFTDSQTAKLSEALDLIEKHHYQDAILLLKPLLNHDAASPEYSHIRQLLSSCFLGLANESIREITRLETCTPTHDAIRSRMERLNVSRPVTSECLVCGDFVPLRFKLYRKDGIKGRICLVCDDLSKQNRADNQVLIQNRIRAAIGDLTLAEYYGDSSAADSAGTLRKKASALKMEVPGTVFWLIKSENLGPDELIRALENADFMVRIAAAQALGRGGQANSRALPGLLVATTDSVEQVRNTANSAVHTIAPHGWQHLPESSTVIEQLLHVYLNGSKESSGFAATELQRSAPEALDQPRKQKRIGGAFKIIAALLMLMSVFALNQFRLYLQNDPEATIKLHTFGALSEQKLVTTLVHALNTGGDTSIESVMHLKQIDPQWPGYADDRKIVEALIAALSSSIPKVRLYAAEALGKLGGVSVDQALALAEIATTDPNRKIRNTAAKSLEKTGSYSKHTVPVLVKSLLSPETGIREAGVAALSSIGIHGIDAAHALTITLADKSAAIRSASATALGQLPDAHDISLNALINGLNDPDPSVRTRVIAALETMHAYSKPALPSLLDHLAANHRDEREAALRALDRIDPDWRDLPPLEQLLPDWGRALDDRDRDVAEAHAEALSLTGDKSLPIFTRALDSSNPVARKIAVDAFRDKTGPAVRVLPTLLLRLGDDSWEVRESAARTLGTLNRHADMAVKGLIRLLDDPYFSVQDAALMALGRIGADAYDAVPVLESMLPEAKPHRRKQIQKVIEKIES